MIHRCLGSAGGAALLAALALATVPVAGQAPAPAKANGTAAKAYAPPKTADGQPDLSGYWTNSIANMLTNARVPEKRAVDAAARKGSN